MVTERSRTTAPWAVVHLDLDGAKHIYRAHGWDYDEADDPLFESGLRGALDLFAGAGVRATLFVIAEDASDARKAALIRQGAAAGHEIASHSLTHGRLTAMDSAAKRVEIVQSRAVLSQAFGVDVLGFRAPGFHRDPECLELINAAGYAYDSSELAGHRRRPRTPYRPLPGQPLLELPLPGWSPRAVPFHPSYSLVVGNWFFRAGLADHNRRANPFVLLFHLTDFADPLPRHQLSGWRQRLFTLSHLTAAHKREKCRVMLEWVQRRFRVMTTTQVLAEDVSGL